MLSVDVAAAVDVDGGAGEVGRVLGGQEGDHGGNLFCGGVPAQRDAGVDGGFLLVGAAHADVGVHGAGGDGVDGDAGGAEFAGQGLGEAQDGRLCRGVRNLAEDAAAALGGYGGHVDDPAPAVPDHARQECLGDQVGAGGVDVHDLVPQLEGGFQERNRGGDAGDVGQGADGREVACGHLGGDGSLGSGHGGFIGDVDLVTEGGDVEFVADFSCHLGGLFAVEVQDDDTPAFTGIAAGGGDADAPVRGGSG